MQLKLELRKPYIESTLVAALSSRSKVLAAANQTLSIQPVRTGWYSSTFLESQAETNSEETVAPFYVRETEEQYFEISFE